MKTIVYLVIAVLEAFSLSYADLGSANGCRELCSSKVKCNNHHGNIMKKFTTGIVAASISLTGILPNHDRCIATAAEWTDRNRLAAETWRAVDEIYIDRTFNGQDWFRMRQEVVKKNYKSDEELFENLKSMLAKLGDKYTRFLTPAQYAALFNSAAGELTGIGAELVTGPTGGTIIDRVEEGTPAQQAGLMKGDVIVNVDGTDASALGPEEVASIMRGREDTKASVRVKRGNTDAKLLDFTAVRKPIKLVGVSFKRLKVNPAAGGGSKQVGYIKIRSFASNTRDEVTTALESLHREDNRLGAMDALVVDLRDNGGGLLQGAVETSNLLIKPGKIVVFVVTKDGLSGAQQTLPNGVLSADPNLPDLSTPLYLLVNSNTASAAEVFAAAMKENGRATLVGEKTFGKGVIQNLQPLRQGGVAVTTTRYETPNHNNINKLGIAVDKPVDCPVDPELLEACISKFL